MRKACLLAALGTGLAAGCASQDQAGPNPSRASQSPAKPAGQIGDAIEEANALLREYKTDWGEPRQVLRTGSNWYRIEYAKAGDGSERVVLVNPADGHAEFPLRR